MACDCRACKNARKMRFDFIINLAYSREELDELDNLGSWLTAHDPQNFASGEDDGA